MGIVVDAPEAGKHGIVEDGEAVGPEAAGPFYSAKVGAGEDSVFTGRGVDEGFILSPGR